MKTLIDPRKEGLRAYQNGLPRSMCPYGILAMHSELHSVTQWHRGWVEAFCQAKKLDPQLTLADEPDA